MAPDEIHGARPVVREGLEHLRAASKAKDYVDLTQQQPSAEELERALHAPEGDAEVEGWFRGEGPRPVCSVASTSPDLPAEFGMLIQRCMARTTASRPSDMTQFIRGLAVVVDAAFTSRASAPGVVSLRERIDAALA